MKVIEVRGLEKNFLMKQVGSGFLGKIKSLFSPQYKKITALSPLDLSVEKGETLAFIGPNGAGKSTTIKILTGILYPTSGEANVLGYIPWKDRQKLAYRIGSVFGQSPQLWYHLPAMDTFYLFSKIYELDEGEYKKRRDELIERFDLSELVFQPVRKLSLGQRMRCEMVASLLHKPELIFLDEPTIGLDVIAKQELRRFIKKLNEEDGVTVFLTSHDAGDIEDICKRAVVISNGEKIFDGSVAHLKGNYLKEKVVEFRTSGKLQLSTQNGLNIVKNDEFFTKAEIDTNILRVSDFISEYAGKDVIEDISISEIPMEEVIMNIYKGGNGN